MSTKTTFKRIALVAVASLGFGMLSVVAANAANVSAVAGSAVVTSTPAAGTATTPGAQGTAIVADLSTITTGANTELVGAAVTYTQTFTLIDPTGNDVTSSVTFTAAPTTVTATQASGVFSVSVPDTTIAGTYKLGTMTFTPTMGGTYLVKQAHSALAGPTLAAAVIATAAATATTGSIYVSGGAVTQGTTRGGPAGAAKTGNQAQVTINFPASASITYKVVPSGVGTIIGKTDTAGASTNISSSTDYSQGFTYLHTANTNANSVVITLASTSAGIQYITTTVVDNTTGLATALYSTSVTWSAIAALLPTASIVRHAPMATVGNVQGDLASTTSAYTAAVDAVPLSTGKTVSTNVATIQVLLVNSDATAATAGHTVTATVSGSGFVLTDMTSTVEAGNARSSYVALTAGSANVAWVHVSADGTAGTGTVSISVTDAISGVTTVIGTESFAFYGSVATLSVASTNYVIGKAGYVTGGASGTQSAAGAAANPLDTTVVDRASAFVIVAKDSNGNAVTTGTVPAIVSSDGNVVTGGTCVLDLGTTTYGSSTNGVGYYNCNFTSAPNAVSGAAATLTVRVADPASITGGFITTTVAIKIGGALAASTLTFDKATYSPGEAMTVTRTGKDVSGNPVYDGAAVGAVTFTKAMGGASVDADFFVGGSLNSDSSLGAKTIFAPAVDGTFSGSLTGKLAAVTSVITANATVENGVTTAAAQAAADAAAEATDAANAATDAANAAAEAADAATAAAQDASDAVAALSAQVSTMINALKKQLIALTNLVIKIQKKVKA